ncbi:MAG: hypothetical protein RSC78_00095 [Acidaminococcaceae bacterium]
METLEPWRNGTSLFSYIKQNINDQHLFTPATLPDTKEILSSSSELVFTPLGEADAQLAMEDEQEDDLSMTELIYEKVMLCATSPTAENHRELYQIVASAKCVTYCDPLIDRLGQEDLPLSLLQLAEEWLYTTPDREALKFTLILCGLFNLDTLARDYDLELRDDLLLLAQCDEFTFFVILAFQMANLEINNLLWPLVQSSNGWGRVHALEAMTSFTATQKAWLVRFACKELTVTYPALALLAIKECNLLSLLQAETIDYELYQGILRTINDYLEFLLDYSILTNADINLSSVNIVSLSTLILRHATYLAVTAEDIAEIINLTHSLQEIITDEHWDIMDINQCHVLIGAAEKIIYQKDWRQELENNIIDEHNKINYLLLDLALALEVDVWQQVFSLLQAHPQESFLYHYLLGFTDDRAKHELVLAFAHQHLAFYQTHENALPPLLKALSQLPGCGTEFVSAGLTSIFDWPRACAIKVLEKWGFDYITPALRVALLRAKDLSQHALLSFRINVLLKQEIVDMPSVLKLIAEVDPH